MAALSVAVVILAVDQARMHNGWAAGFDLGVFDQAAWLLAHGHAHISILGRNVFVDHLAPVLLAFAPLYRLHPSATWLLGAQALAIGATVAPMRKLASLERIPPWVATVATVANASLLSAAIYDFHTSTLAAPAVAWLLLGARRDDRRLTGFAAVGVLLCRVDLVSVIVGVCVVARPRARRVAAVVALVGVVTLAVMPALGGGGVWALHYGSLGRSPVDLALHPWRLVVGLLRPGTPISLLWWLAPAGLLPLYRPRWLVALVVAGFPVLLIQWTLAHAPWFQYGAPLAPLALGGAFAALSGMAPTTRHCSVRNLMGWLAVTALALSPISLFRPTSHNAFAIFGPGPGYDSQLPLSDIRPDEAVSAAEWLVPRVSHRREIYDFPAPFLAGGTHGNRGPSPEAASHVQVVIVSTSDAHLLPQIGFTRIVYRDRQFVMARRP